MVKWLKQNSWLLLILAVAIFLRSYKLNYLELFGDEVDAGYQAYSLMLTGKDYKGHMLPVYAQSFSEWRAPGMMYAMIPFIKIFGLNEWGVRSMSAFFGVTSILGIYFLLKELGIDKKYRLATGLLVAITPWHIQYSRSGFEITLLSTVLLWGTYFLIRSIKNNSLIWLILSGILYCLGLYTYNTANVYVPLLVLTTLIIFKAKAKTWGQLLIVGLIFSLPLGYQIIFGHAADRFATVDIFNNKDVVAQVNDYRNAGRQSLLAKVFFNKLVVGGKRIVFNYSNAFGSNFLFKDGDVTFRHSLHQVGNLYWTELPLIVLGIGLFLINKRKTPADWWLLVFLLISPIPSSLTIDGYNHATRLFMMIFPLSYFAAKGLIESNRWIKIAALILIVGEFTFYQYYYWNFYRNESWRWWHTGYKQAMTYIKNNQNSYSQVVMDNTYEPALIRYLFWNQIDPKLVFNLDDKMNKKVDNFNGFCLSSKACFVDYGSKFSAESLQKNKLYLISQERNVGGDWDWSKNPPSGVVVKETVRNYDGTPIFYLVTKL